MSARERFWKRAIKIWVDVHTLPETNPLSRITSSIKKFYPYYLSPLHQVAKRLKDAPLSQMETITPISLEPWTARLKTLMDKLSDGWTIAFVVSSSARNGIVGAGGLIQSKVTASDDSKREVFYGKRASLACIAVVVCIIRRHGTEDPRLALDGQCNPITKHCHFL